MVERLAGGTGCMQTVEPWLATFEALNLPALFLETGSAAILRSTAASDRLLGGPRASGGYAWLERIHPEDRLVLESALRSRQPARVALRISSDDLVFRTFDVDLRCIDEFSFVILNERTGDRESDKPQLEALLEALPFDVWERDANGILFRQNTQARRNWGAKLGSNIDQMGLGPDVTELWKQMNSRALKGEVVSMPADYEVAGRRVNYVNLIAPVREAGKIRGVVGVNIDITATRVAEAELAHAREHLVHRERLAALGELAAVVAHEVRNPLGSIFNSLASLRKQLTLSGDAALLFGILEEEADRLNHTVADLLNYVRPLEPERRPDDLVELARDALRLGLRTLRVGRGSIEAEVNVAGAIETFEVDPTLLRIALTNLVANAVQAMPDGGKVTLNIGAKKCGAREGVAISVSDTGKGIPPAILARVFEPFFTTRASGTGLGLAVVRRIVEAHEGTVWAESDVEQGTAFTLLLPR